MARYSARIACKTLVLVVALMGLVGLVLPSLEPVATHAQPSDPAPWAPRQQRLRIVGQRGGVTLGMAPHGPSGLVAGVGPRVQRFALRPTAGAPRLEAGERSVLLADVVRDVAVDGDRALVAAGRAGLLRFDLAGPLSRWPAPTSHLAAANPTVQVAVDGDMVVRVVELVGTSAQTRARVELVEMGADGTLTPRASLLTPPVVDLALAGRTLVLETLDSPQLRAYDLSDPRDPTALVVPAELQHREPLPRTGNRTLASLDAHAGRMAVGTEQAVFLVRRREDELVIDRRLELPYGAGLGQLAFDGRRVAATGWSFKVWSLDVDDGHFRELTRVRATLGIDAVALVADTLVTASEVGLELVDLVAPAPVARLATPHEPTIATGITLAPGRTIVASHGERVVTLPTAMLGHDAHGGVAAPSGCNGVDPSGLTWFDARSPFVPTSLHRVGGHLWVMGRSQSGWPWLVHGVNDVATGCAPTLPEDGPAPFASAWRQGEAVLLTSSESELAWAFQNNELHVFDLGAPPGEWLGVSIYQTRETFAAPIARDGEHGVVAGRDNLWLLRPDPQGGPVPTRSLAAPLPLSAIGVALQGDLAVVGSGAGGGGILRTYDVARPNDVQALGAIDLQDLAPAMAFARPGMLVATRRAGAAGPASIHLVDLSLPAFPDEVAFAEIAGAPDAVAADGRLVAVAAGGAGVYWLLDFGGEGAGTGLDVGRVVLPWVGGQ